MQNFHLAVLNFKSNIAEIKLTSLSMFIKRKDIKENNTELHILYYSCLESPDMTAREKPLKFPLTQLFNNLSSKESNHLLVN